MVGNIGINLSIIRLAAVSSDLETYSIILIMYGLNYFLLSNSTLSGRFSGFLFRSCAIINLTKGESFEGRGAGSVSDINF